MNTDEHHGAKNFFLVFCLTLISYCVLLILVARDTAYTYRWILLGWYFFTLLLTPLYFVYEKKAYLLVKTRHMLNQLYTQAGKRELLLFLCIFTLALGSRFILLKEHPFLTWGDELWETGLDTLGLLSGKTKNFYLIGFPDSYRGPSMGLIITLIPALFAPFFAHTPFMYRIPAAFFGTADIILVYCMCRMYINRSVALYASLALIALPIHIYFSRTELVVISDACITTSIIFLLFLTRYRFFENTRWLALVGLWLGVTVTFHPSVRVISLICFGMTFIVYTIKALRQKDQNSKWISLGKYVAILFMYAFIGFGPKILFVTPVTFLHSETSVLFQDIEPSQLKKLTPHVKTQLIKNVVNVFTKRYPASFLGYITEPLTNLVEFHYTEEKPLLPPLFAFLFLAGLVSLLWTTPVLPKWFGFFALLIPLTHSALTPEVNWSYRLFVASSSTVVLIGVGMWQIVSRITVKLINYGLITAFCVYLFYTTMRFFILEPQMANRPVEEYMTTHFSYFLQSHLRSHQNYLFCMRVNPEQLKFLNWVHAHNQYQYFAPNTTIEVSADPGVAINSIYLEENCQPKATYSQYIVKCSQNLYSICPQPTQFRQQNEPNEINKDFVFYY